MQLNAYCIYDNKAMQYHPPYFASTDAAAARAFGDLANDINTNVGRHPSDYVLYAVGTFNDANASLTPQAPLRHVADASSLLALHAARDLFQTSAGKESHEVYQANYDHNGSKL